MKKNFNIIISGGGTGGHVFPAISIAQALKEMAPGSNILFVGARGKLEMEKVPAAGFDIVGLPVMGFQRRLTYKNVLFFYYLFVSMIRSFFLVKRFKPDLVLGVGGYASGPVLRMAGWFNIPVAIQEQNSYAGITNRLLAKKAHKIFVAYEGMEKYFPAGKIFFTGNPVRMDLIQTSGKDKKQEALHYFRLNPGRKTILALGGSLGARTINESIQAHFDTLLENEIQVIWQSGKLYYQEIRTWFSGLSGHEAEANHSGIESEPRQKNDHPGSDKNGPKTDESHAPVRIFDFISRMDLAYAAADLIISRAGAGTISELCLVGKPVVLVPSPNVAEDHQTHNAKAIENIGGGILVRDQEAREKLVADAIALVEDEEKCNRFAKNITKLGMPDSSKMIAGEILKIYPGKHSEP